jgi:hypothetical protein
MRDMFDRSSIPSARHGTARLRAVADQCHSGRLVAFRAVAGRAVRLSGKGPRDDGDRVASYEMKIGRTRLSKYSSSLLGREIPKRAE